MDAAWIKRAESLFLDAASLTAAARGPMLDAACGDDDELRRFVDRMLKHDADGMGQFLCTPALNPSGPPIVEGPPLPQQIGRYRLISIIGEGGMGVVYKARQENPPRTVALKAIRPGCASPRALRRFAHEAELLGMLQHPGIACVYEAGVTTLSYSQGTEVTQPFFAMEYVEGQSLCDYVAEHRLDTRARLELFARICDIVQYAHQKGVIHRDLKPGNVLVTADGQPKVLDFGVARLTDSAGSVTGRYTHAGDLLGTLPYMSPEQMVGDPDDIDTRLDIYALGVVLYELLAGQPPYSLEGKNLTEVSRVICEVPPTRLGTLRGELRGEIETIVAKALEKDKARRYQSAAAFASDLRRYLCGRPIEAKSDSGWYVLRKTLARYRLPVAAAAAMIVLISASAIALGVMAHNQAQARAAADDARASEARQREDAERSARRAAEEAEKATAVVEVLEEMLGAANPRVGQGPDYTLRELLDDFVRDLPSGLENQPAVTASLLHIVGRAYFGIALYEQAEQQLRTAVQVSVERTPDLHHAIATYRNSLADVLLTVGRTAEAEQQLDLAMEDTRQVVPIDPTQTAAILSNLGLALERRGLYGPARKHHEHALQIRREKLPTGHPHVAVSLNNLAVLARRQGDLGQAEQLYREALAINRHHYGDDHPQVASNLHNLALVLQSRGEYTEAEALYRAALTVRRKSYGDHHPDVARTLNCLAGVFEQRGDYANAEAQYREALAIRRSVLPPQHPDIARSLSNLASVRRALGDLAEAENLAREALDITRAAHPGGHPEIADRLFRLATMLADQDQCAQAGELLAEAVAIRTRAYGVDDWRVAALESLLGDCVRRDGEYERAEELLLRSQKRLEQLGPTPLPEQLSVITATLERLVRLYDSWGRPEQASAWRARSPTPPGN